MTRWGAHLAGVTRVWFPGGALLLLLGAVQAAHASDLRTVNTTTAYVDPSVTAEFVTVPNLCLEPYGDQGTTTGCDELGERAVTAYQGTSTDGDIYFESASTPLATTNAFVPGNVGNGVNSTGYAPLFSDHKYDLFGRAEDRLGLLTRREILLMDNVVTTGNGITTGQTVPGEDTIRALVARVLAAPQGVTSFSAGGHTFQLADLPTYERVTGFTTGQRNTVVNYCTVTYGFGSCSNPQFAAEIYIEVFFPEINPTPCASQADPVPFPSNCLERDAWMDQVVVGYAEAWDSLGGDDHFVQNFRSQVGYDATSTILASNTEVWTDFRLEQSVELSGAFTTRASDPGDAITPGDNMDGLAGRQTFQQAIATESLNDFGFLRGPGTIGQMVSQDVQGYLMTCFNCESAAGSHAFAPAPADLTFMPYQSGWEVVPTVVHAP